MRLFLGAIVGLLLGSLLLAVFISQLEVRDYWTMLPVGLIIGLCVRNFAVGKYGGYPGGALAVIATSLAMVVGPYVATKMIVSQRPDATTNSAAINQALPQEGDAAEGEAEDGEAEVVAEPVVALAPPKDDVPGINLSSQPKGDLPPLDIVFIAVGCLIAYEVAKGKPKASEEGDGEEEADSEAPAEQESSE